jgi:transcriptional regulator with XRE-family HTH domain
VDDFYARLGEQIRATRREGGITQEEVAERLSLNRTTIVNIEKGRQRLAVHQLVNLAAVLGCEPASLLPSEVSERERFVETILARRSSGDG